MKLYRKGPHTTFDLKYHLVWTVKYKYPILRGRIGTRVRDLIREICTEHNITIIRGHVSKDHLPHKVWTECVKCVYFPNRCVEYAMVKDLSGPGAKPSPMIIRKKSPPSRRLPLGTIVPSEPIVPGATVAQEKRS